jgi:hypothetical protein
MFIGKDGHGAIILPRGRGKWQKFPESQSTVMIDGAPILSICNKEITMSNFPSEELNALITKHFGFLVGEYGFALKKKSEQSYDFETSTTRISIFIEYNTLAVAIEPIGEEARKLLRNNILPEQLDVIVVAESLVPDLDYKVIWDEPIPSAMERESQLVKNYCVGFLKGDFTKWTDVLDALKRRK